MQKNIVFGSDHAGYELKNDLQKDFLVQGYTCLDVGTYSLDSTDYPNYAHALSAMLLKNPYYLGVLICGSGNGIAMTANKHAHIRAALCWEVEIARLARLHNNANVLVLPARFVSLEKAKEILQAFLHTDFEGGRHEARVKKINLF